MNWTDAQREAIEHSRSDLLVAAGAGAGKTGVLTERVARLVADGVPVTELLVVTFTDAAAGEMRERIARRLAGALDAARAAGDAAAASRIARQVVLLDAGQICTLHAFCNQLLHENFALLGLDPAFDILDESEALLLRQETLDALLESYYADGGEEGRLFREMLHYEPGRGDARLRATVLRLHGKINSLADPADWWRRVLESIARGAAAGVADTFWAAPLRRLLELECQAASSRLEQARAIAASADEDLSKYQRDLGTLAEGVESLLAALKGRDFWGVLAERVADYPVKKMSPLKREVECAERLKALVKMVKETWKELAGLVARPQADVLADLSATAPLAGLLAEMVERFGGAYAAAKRERAALDFNDLERLAYDLLTRHEEAAAAVRARYRQVLVDEYQDISPVQAAILRAVAGPSQDGVCRLFMVGDLKQSIYRFRFAEPDIFARTMADFAAGRGGRLVHLAENFRSRSVVLAAVNALFERLMLPMHTLIEESVGPAYDADAALRFACPDYGDGAPPDPAVELHLLAADAGDAPDPADDPEAGNDEGPAPADATPDELGQLARVQLQARLIGRRLRTLLGLDGSTPVTVWDNDAEVWRGAQPRDVVILLRSASRIAPAIVEQLTAMDVPVHAAATGSYFEAVEVNDLRALLAVLDNPRQDVPLAALLRSPLMGLACPDGAAAGDRGGVPRGALTADELARIRLADREVPFHDAVVAAATDDAVDAGLRLRLTRLLERLTAWRTMSRRRPLSELLADVFRATGYLDYVAGLAGGAQRRANLLDLAARARQFDAFARQGLARFLRFLDELESAGEDLGTPGALSEADNVVRILTIHRAKGLEFPIVVLADLEHQFNRDDVQDDVLFHRSLLMGLRRLDRRRRVRYASLPHRLIARQLQLESAMEEMRLLYVAMTRARERLILVGSDRDPLRRLQRDWAEAASAQDLPAATNYLVWIGPAMLAGTAAGRVVLDTAAGLETLPPDVLEHEEGLLNVRIYGPACLRRELGATVLDAAPARRQRPTWVADAAAGRPIGRAAGGDLDPADAAVRDAVERGLTFAYPQADLTRLAAKMSVSELKRLFDTRAEADEAVPQAMTPRTWRRDERAPWDRRDDASALARGTATHTLLQRLDLSGPLEQAGEIRRQAERMAEEGVFTLRQPGSAPGKKTSKASRAGLADLVDVEAVAAFFAGDVGRLIRASRDRVRREWAFSMAMDAGDVLRLTGGPGAAASADGDFVLVQGIIDLLCELEDGSLLVLDYKTDAVRTEEQLADRVAGYRGQVALYARAAELILARPVSRRCLYFLRPRRLVELE